MKLGVIQVILWTFGVRLALLLSMPFAVAASPRFLTDLVEQAALLAVFYLGACALFAWRRPGRTWSETFAIRRTSPWLVLLCVTLGVVTYFPADALTGLVARLFPLSDAELKANAELMTARSLLHAVVLFVFVAGIGPFSEELLFRGALYTGLRPNQSPAYAGWVTGILFTLGHEPRAWPAILALSGLLALTRAVSGSLWPPLFLHVAFNATSLAMTSPQPFLDGLGLGLVVGCLATSVLLVLALGLVGRTSTSADRARQVDLERDPGLGETPS